MPNANEALSPGYVVRELREKRVYHSARLREFCDQQGIPATATRQMRRPAIASKMVPTPNENRTMVMVYCVSGE